MLHLACVLLLSLSWRAGAVPASIAPQGTIVQEERSAVPDAGVEAALRARVVEVFAAELQGAQESRLAKRELAVQLLEAGARMEQPDERYVYLRLALDLAVENYAVSSVELAIDGLQESHAVSGFELRSDAVVALAPLVRHLSQATVELGELGLGLVEECYGQERTAEGLVLLDALEPAIEAVEARAKTNAAIEAVFLRFLRLQRETRELHGALVAEALVAEALFAEPFVAEAPGAELRFGGAATDRDAALEAGLFFFFVRREAERGLALLGASSDIPLRQLAQTEIGDPKRPEQRLQAADEWLAWVEEQLLALPLEPKPRQAVQRRIDVARERAAHWIASGLEGLGGTDRIAREKQLAEVRELLPELVVGPAAAAEAELEAGPEPEAGPSTEPAEVATPEGEAPLVTGSTRVVGGGLKSRVRRMSGSSEVNAMVDAGLDWLLGHQSVNGFWSAANFSTNCGRAGGDKTCTGEGAAGHTVGVTGLAALALMSSGRRDAEQAAVRGLEWIATGQVLRGQDLGLFGGRHEPEFLYGQAIATLALCRAQAFGLADFREAIARSLGFLAKGQQPGEGWRYAIPTDGESDPSVTGWVAQALLSARDLGFEVEPTVFVGALRAIDARTDMGTQLGKVGYYTSAEGSSRLSELLDAGRYPAESDESLSAAALSLRLALREEGAEFDELEHAQLARIGSALPAWEVEELMGQRLGGNFYYAYQGSQALVAAQRAGAELPEAWFRALEQVLLEHQADAGHAAGSWEPDGPWGYAGGRVYSTSMALLALTALWQP